MSPLAVSCGAGQFNVICSLVVTGLAAITLLVLINAAVCLPDETATVAAASDVHHTVDRYATHQFTCVLQVCQTH